MYGVGSAVMIIKFRIVSSRWMAQESGWGFGHDSRETHARFAREKRNSPSHAAMPERELPGGYMKKNKWKRRPRM